ncbi:protein PAT1 homolog 2 [Aplochiton taeniatus]
MEECVFLQEMAEEDEEIDIHNSETFGMDLDAEENYGDPTNSFLQFGGEPPHGPPAPPLSPPLSPISPPLPRHCPLLRPQGPPGFRGRDRGPLGGQSRSNLFDDPAVMRTVEGRPSLKSLDSAIVDCGLVSSWNNMGPNTTEALHSPSKHSCPSTPQSLTPKMMQLRFGANSPRPSPIYSPSNNPVQRFRYPGPVTQLHPQHRRLLSQRRQISQRKSESWDPYCNIMTAKEKEWITKLQMIQLQAENPYLEDYYYQEYYRRMEAKLVEEELGIKNKREPLKLTTPYITKTDSYTSLVHIEGSLGQVAVSTCYSPRRAISAVHAVQAQSPHEEHRDLEQQRLKVLKKIEMLFIVLLEVEEAEKIKSTLLGEGDERRLMEKTRTKIKHIYSELQHCDSLEPAEKFVPCLLIPKGKRLVARLLPFLSQEDSLTVLRVMTSHLPLLMSRDTDESLPALYPSLRTVIGGLTFSQLISVLKEMTTATTDTDEGKENVCLTLACQNKFGLSLLYALLSQGERLLSSDVPLKPSIGDFETWTDTVFLVAWQLCQSSLVEPLVLPSNLLTLFCRYLDKGTVHQLKSNIESATGYLALASQ